MVSDSRGVSYKRGVAGWRPAAPTSTNTLAVIIYVRDDIHS